ncbi:MAG: polysaccharide pyruvyl transferase family protein, partial [Erysipelotrichaceae bacterium]|nr:polysaccharide pyruvyl transferase family protein [Erysipelotrichaceae bacterium]
HLVVTVSSGYHQMQEWFDNVEYSYSSIPEWLSLIEKSRVFVTTSFHGVVFALLFHSNFIFVPLTNVSGSNDRLVSLLEPLGLLNRIWDKNRDLKSIIYEKIDWEKVDKKIETYRQSSREWLKFNLSKCK